MISKTGNRTGNVMLQKYMYVKKSKYNCGVMFYESKIFDIKRKQVRKLSLPWFVSACKDKEMTLDLKKIYAENSLIKLEKK